MSPVPSSSSLFRQHRPQPSHRLSHSPSDSSSNVLVFQKNPSWPEGRLGAAVMRLNKGSKELRLMPSRASGREAASNAPVWPVMNRGQLGLLFKIASVTIGL